MKTWDENRAVINQLWPQCQWTDEERRLWKDDLSGLEQDVLYDSLRNVKRSRDTLYPQLKWILDEYRALSSARKRASRQTAMAEPKLGLSISDAEDQALAEDFLALIDVSEPADFGDIETRVLDKLPSMHSRTAIRVLNYARLRLLGQSAQFGRVSADGDVAPVAVGGRTA